MKPLQTMPVASKRTRTNAPLLVCCVTTNKMRMLPVHDSWHARHLLPSVLQRGSMTWSASRDQLVDRPWCHDWATSHSLSKKTGEKKNGRCYVSDLPKNCARTTKYSRIGQSDENHKFEKKTDRTKFRKNAVTLFRYTNGGARANFNSTVAAAAQGHLFCR